MISEKASALKAALCGDGRPNLYGICENFTAMAASWDEKDGAAQLRIFLKELTIRRLAGELTEDFLDLDPAREKMFQEYLGLENRVVSNLLRSRISEEAFYNALWEKLRDDALLPDTPAKAAFLFFLRLDNRIPYFELGEGCIMDDETYREVVERIRPAIDKGAFILSANLQYKTQRASLLLDVAKSLASEEEQIVFWAVLLARLRSIQVLQKQRDEFSKD